MRKLLLLFIIFNAAYQNYFGQIKIKEEVEVTPSNTENILQSDLVSGVTENPIYLNFGGTVTLRPIHRTNYSYELWKESFGKIKLDCTDTLGVFQQWHEFNFYLYDSLT